MKLCSTIIAVDRSLNDAQLADMEQYEQPPSPDNETTTQTSETPALLRVNPYASNLGSYIRPILLFVTVSLIAWFVYGIIQRQTEYLSLVASLLLLGSLITYRGAAVLRIIILVAMTINVLARVINPNDFFGSAPQPATELPIYILLASLLTADFFEIKSWFKATTREVLLKTMGWGLLMIPALVYIVGMPLFNSVFEYFEQDEKKLALKDPNWNVWNEAGFRAAKFAVFMTFTYLGACVGSFLNVVAYCIPRGESIGLRDSKCPKCEKEITRIDNLPIFSYINLGAKCRNCQLPIPIRYLMVELVAAAIFGSLFLYQLVTGCSNVPGIDITHKGILWIILYPKWPIISIYFFHSFFMCMLLVVALFEQQQQALRVGFAIVIGGTCLLLASALPVLQPVPLFDHFPGNGFLLSPIVEQVLKVGVGLLLGAILGRLLALIVSAAHPSILTFAFGLAGIVLGWQALLQVTLVFALLLLFGKSIRFMPLLRYPTSTLLLAVFVHHPFWQAIAKLW